MVVVGTYVCLASTDGLWWPKITSHRLVPGDCYYQPREEEYKLVLGIGDGGCLLASHLCSALICKNKYFKNCAAQLCRIVGDSRIYDQWEL